MNLLLHGLDAPAIDYGNSLAVKITELGEKDRVDVTSPIHPSAARKRLAFVATSRRTSKRPTALLFLQLIMRKLRKPNASSQSGGRAAVVVPNGTLFGDGVLPQLRRNCSRNLTCTRLCVYRLASSRRTRTFPQTSYFSIVQGPREDIWYYATPLPEGRKKYSKTNPMRIEEFTDCVKWFQLKRRRENDHAWRVSASDVLKYDDGILVSCNLDIKNPTVPKPEHLPPEQLAEDILAKERRIIEIMEEIKVELAGVQR